MKIRICLLLTLSLLTIATRAQTADSLKYTVITDKQFIEKFNAIPGATLVDARGPKEYRKSRIAGAVNIEWPLPDTYFTGPSAPPKDKPVFVYCYVGNRSRKVAVIFYDHGYRDLYSLKGGFNEWKAHKNPIERRRKTMDLRRIEEPGKK